MTETKLEAIALIESIPDENSDMLVKIVKNIRELLGVESKSRAEKNLAIMDEVKALIGKDIPWHDEADMIRELAEMRRHRAKS